MHAPCQYYQASILRGLVTLGVLEEEYNLLNSSLGLRCFILPPADLCFLGPNILFRTSFSDISNRTVTKFRVCIKEKAKL